MSKNESSINIFGEDLEGYSTPVRNKDLVGGSDFEKHILVCTDQGTDGCSSKGGFDIKKEFYGRLEDRKLDQFKVSSVRSMGFCDRGPVAVVYPDEVWYENLTLEDIPKIIDEHLIGDEQVESLTFDPDIPSDQSHFIVCTFLSACGPEGGGKVYGELNKRSKESDQVKVTQSYGCLKECSLGPVCASYPDGKWYPYVADYKLDKIWERLTEGKQTNYSSGKISTDN